MMDMWSAYTLAGSDWLAWNLHVLLAPDFLCRFVYIVVNIWQCCTHNMFLQCVPVLLEFFILPPGQYNTGMALVMRIKTMAAAGPYPDPEKRVF